ncbi:MAG: EAL domain-containing protein [Gammaproteobacteria bacterium]|nr:EAL domain-containing protein [Gammaproteobacteria bacterium]
MATTVLTGLLITALQAERLQAEGALRANEEKLRGLYELSPLGIALTDMQGSYVEFNEAFKKICGYNKEELQALDYWALTPRKYAAEEARQLESLQSLGCYGPYEKEYIRKDGRPIPLRLNGMLITGSDGKQYIWSIVEDITERKLAEEEIKYLAFYDPLTHLPNRRLLKDRLNQAMTLSSRSGHSGGLLFIDLDNFKTLNDTLGHDQGDLLLEHVAHCLVGCVREGDTVARFGGDEFVILLEELSKNQDEAATQTRQVAEKIRVTLNQFNELDGRGPSSCSIGATLFSGHRDSVEELLKQADLAMYQAKAAGRNVVRFFDQGMQAVVNARVVLETNLRQGLHRNEFVLFYQPQVDSEGHMTGVEALVRWQHPERGVVSPYEFISLAEETGLILPLGHWVLETACMQQVAWSTRPALSHLTVSVNISARQFRHPDFTEQVMAVLDTTGADPSKLKLEITESLLLDNVEDIITKMTVLKARGVSFSLDDFGTGYSSLFYLKRLPLDQVKIDQSFVRDVLTDPNDAAIVRTIIALAHTLGISVIAEGVETKAQRDFLAGVGCHAYQGYFFGRPGPVDVIERLPEGCCFVPCDTP